MPSFSGESLTQSPHRTTIRRLKTQEDAHEFQQKVEEELNQLVPFGPIYNVERDDKKEAKDSAWDHILNKTGSKVARYYKISVRKVEVRAMQSYEIPDSEKPTIQEFREMMLKDGCLFLQLTLHILGGGHLLQYPEHHAFFGKDIDSTSWMPHMFFPGNQIPYDVIRALMDQSFFKNVIQKGTWKRPPEIDLPKLALYLTVVEPELERRSPLSQQMGFRWGKPRLRISQLPPSTILHCLHKLFVGSTEYHPIPIYSNMNEFHDFEVGRADDSIVFPSAEELHRLGIKLRKAKTPGIKDIRFRDLGYCGKLYLPTLVINSGTKNILTNLVRYEQALPGSRREVTSYLRFMRHLVRTREDLKILEVKGIILASQGTMSFIPDHLLTIYKCSFTAHFRQIRGKITDYEAQPRLLIRTIIRIAAVISAIVGIFSIVGTVFTILAYYVPRN